MRTIFFIIINCILFCIDLRPQSRDLPAEIQSFYDNKNFVSVFSLKIERDLISLKLLKGKELPEIRDERLIRIRNILTDLSGMILSQPVMANSKVIPYELLLSEICRPFDWERTNNTITIMLYTFTFCSEDNTEFVSNYNRDLSPADIDKLDQSSFKFSSRRIHKWHFKNNTWHKSSVNLVLVE